MQRPGFLQQTSAHRLHTYKACANMAVHPAKQQHRIAALSEKAASLVQQWLDIDNNPHTRSEVQAWVDDCQEDIIQQKLSKRLEFGTAGLRGRMGAGYNAMNTVVVQQTTQGLCRYLQQQCPALLKQHGLVIGFDGRHHSKEFAHTAAGVFVSQGIPVHLYGGLVPTPFVAAAVSELRAAAGIMITASHNPKQDNGYKVYWSNGCQIIPPHDEGIAAAILDNLQLWDIPDISRGHPLVSDPSETVQAAYYQRLKSQLALRGAEHNSAAQPVTYTPLHGVGAQPLLQAFQVAGLPAPHLVSQQAQPDPEFPTVVFPNPEEGAGTWSLAFQTGRAHGCQLILANDPDADRLAVAEADSDAPGGYHAFTGNEIGALLAWWLWSNRKRLYPQVADSQFVMLASVVSSAFLGAVAAQEGFKFEQTLTGFKWLGNRALELRAQGYTVLFAYEEAIGFMPGPMYPDKDGISAAVCMAELAAELYSRGSSLKQQLARLYEQYGTPAYRSGYFISNDPAKTKAVFNRIRGTYPKAIANEPVAWICDLGTGYDSSQPDEKAKLPWREGDMMISFGLQAGAVLTIRASGTEPKLKYYLEVLDNDVEQGQRLADALVTAIDQELIRVDELGLQRPQQAA